MTAGPPARIDRPALERILQRAAELQAAERDVGEGLTADEVLDLGNEVGIPAQYLRRAMMEDQSRGLAGLAAAGGVVGRTVGPAEVTAVRVIAGEPERIEQALLYWLDKQELMVVVRHQPGWISWERDRGMRAALRRGMSSFEDAGRAKYMLARSDVVTATITRLEPGFCHVNLTASAKGARSGYLGGALAVTSVGAAATTVAITLGAAPVVALGSILWLGLGYGITRLYKPVLERLQLGLERALDHAEVAGVKPAHQIPPRGPGLLEMISTEVKRALK